MRNTMVYEQSDVARNGARAAPGAAPRGLLSGIRKFMAAVVEEILRIPDYIDQAEALREGLRRAHSNRRERDG